MYYYFLDEDLYFPPPDNADENGILAIGGDLKPERLLLAYRSGIFPWFSEGEPIIWWSPDPRFVLYPHKLKVAKSMRPIFNKGVFRITFDQNFEDVIKNCKTVSRKGQDSTWITPEMAEAYCRLHHLGLAHSVGVWQDEELVGGLYGVSLGKCFFGESMFSKISNASKAGFITLVQRLTEKGFQLIDCQVHTEYLESLGAELISRNLFLNDLDVCLEGETLQGNWGEILLL